MGGTLQAFFRNKVFGSKLPLVLEVCLDKDLISQQLTVNSCGPLLWPPLQKAQASKPGALCKPVASQWPSGNKTGDLITALQQCSWWWPYERLKDSLPTKAHGVSSADSNLWAKQPKSSWASHVWEAATGAKAPSKRGESSWTLICLSPLLLTETSGNQAMGLNCLTWDKTVKAAGVNVAHYECFHAGLWVAPCSSKIFQTLLAPARCSQHKFTYKVFPEEQSHVPSSLKGALCWKISF